MADALTRIPREGAQRLLASAIEAEAIGFIQQYRGEKTNEGLSRVVRNAYMPHRAIQTIQPPWLHLLQDATMAAISPNQRLGGN